MLASAMDEKALQRRLTELFIRLGYETEARSLANGTNVRLTAEDGTKLEVSASKPDERSSRRRRRR